MPAIQVKPCPFCGQDDVEIDEIDLRCFAVCCPDCECIGPVVKTTVEDAIEMWNKRQS